MQLTAGTHLRSAVDLTEVIVVRADGAEVDVRCGGIPMQPKSDASPAAQSIDDRFNAGTLIGKRYVNEADTVELLCVKAGQGTLTLGDEPLQLKSAKPLPASD